MKNRTKAWIIFLTVWWTYPFCRIYGSIKNFIQVSVDCLERKLKEIEEEEETEEETEEENL